MVHGRTMDFKSSIHSNKSFKSESTAWKMESEQDDETTSQRAQANIIDLNEMTKSSRSNGSDNADKGSVESLKTQRTHKSRSEILNARLAVQGQIHRLEDKTPQSNYVHSQVTNIMHSDRRKKYSLGSPQKTLNAKVRSVKDTPVGPYNIGSSPERVVLNSTQMDFVYPEPLYSPGFYKKGINRYHTRSQPESLHRDQSYYSPKVGFRGNGFFRNGKCLK